MKLRFTLMSSKKTFLRQGFTLIELLVVISIVSLLITLGTTAFFGAMSSEDVTKGKKQFKDIINSARQEAVISGKPTLLLCWNASFEQKVGNKTISTKQGHYAIFTYVGNAWPSGRNLGSPFGLERETFYTLETSDDEPLPIFNLAGNSDKPVRVKYVANNPNREENDSEKNKQNDAKINSITIPVWADGATTGDKLVVYSDNGELGCLELEKSLGQPENEMNTIPVAIRTSTNFSLPEGFRFNTDRQTILFNADGTLAKDSSVSLTITPNNTKNSKDTQKVTIHKTGEVKFEE